MLLYSGDYVYKAEVNWSLLTEGLTLTVENQVVFSRNMGKFLQRGEQKEITLYLNGKGYKAQIRHLTFQDIAFGQEVLKQERARGF